MKTRFTSMLGIRKPIALPMTLKWATPTVVASVSRAGGFGILPASKLTPLELEGGMRQVRRLAPGKAFGVSLVCADKKKAAIALREGASLVAVGWPLPDEEFMQEAKRCGVKVMAQVATERQARDAERLGADALLVAGREPMADGSASSNLFLVWCIRSRNHALPLVAAGNFGHGVGLLAAVSVGADGCTIGPKLASARESPLSAAAKGGAAANAPSVESLIKQFMREAQEAHHQTQHKISSGARPGPPWAIPALAAVGAVTAAMVCYE